MFCGMLLSWGLSSVSHDWTGLWAIASYRSCGIIRLIPTDPEPPAEVVSAGCLLGPLRGDRSNSLSILEVLGRKPDALGGPVEGK